MDEITSDATEAPAADVVYRYAGAATGEFFPGVPQRDLTQADLDALSAENRANVEISAERRAESGELIGPYRRVKE